MDGDIDYHRYSAAKLVEMIPSIDRQLVHHSPSEPQAQWGQVRRLVNLLNSE
jgi:hypothetical protein